MKKNLSLILAIIMLSLFTACGTSNNTPPVSDKEVATVNTAPPANTPSAFNSKEAASSSSATSESKENENGNKPQIPETVIYDDGSIKVTAKELVYDDFWGSASVKVLIENNSSKGIVVQCRNFSVNDIMIDPMFSSDIATGKKSNDSITIMSNQLENAGISEIQSIEFNLAFIDSNTWETIMESNTIILKTDASGKQEIDDSGIPVLDMNGVRIIAKEINSSNSFWGAELYLYIENNTDKNLTVQTRDTSINGFMIEPYFSCDIAARKKAFDAITFMEEDFTKNDITDVEDLELKFYVYESDSWNEYFETDSIVINFE